jgi:flavin reductase (DIM6/NTAB) family NADH-FMN oxidoreductase RutF
MQFNHGMQVERFHNLPMERGNRRILCKNTRVAGAMAWFASQLEKIITTCGHDILIGTIIDFGSHDAESLIFSQRHFGTLRQF